MLAREGSLTAYHLNGPLSAKEGNLLVLEGLCCSERALLRSTKDAHKDSIRARVPYTYSEDN